MCIYIFFDWGLVCVISRIFDFISLFCQLDYVFFIISNSPKIFFFVFFKTFIQKALLAVLFLINKPSLSAIGP